MRMVFIRLIIEFMRGFAIGFMAATRKNPGFLEATIPIACGMAVPVLACRLRGDAAIRAAADAPGCDSNGSIAIDSRIRERERRPLMRATTDFGGFNRSLYTLKAACGFMNGP